MGNVSQFVMSGKQYDSCVLSLGFHYSLSGSRVDEK